MKLVIVLLMVVVCMAQRRRQDDYYEDPRAEAYKFGYSTGNDGPAQIFREETKAQDGSIVGKYGYVDPNGQLRIIHYRSAPKVGFEASESDRDQNQAAPQLSGNPSAHYNVEYPYEGAFQYQQLY